MQQLVSWLFSSSGFMPHGHCYLWQPGTLWLNVASDAVIASAYYAITARALAETQLREQDKRKDEFLATLAHELRKPLAPIRHAIRLFGSEHSTAEQQRWGREVIDRQAHRMALRAQSSASDFPVPSSSRTLLP